MTENVEQLVERLRAWGKDRIFMAKESNLASEAADTIASLQAQLDKAREALRLVNCSAKARLASDVEMMSCIIEKSFRDIATISGGAVMTDTDKLVERMKADYADFNARSEKRHQEAIAGMAEIAALVEARLAALKPPAEPVAKTYAQGIEDAAKVVFKAARKFGEAGKIAYAIEFNDVGDAIRALKGE